MGTVLTMGILGNGLWGAGMRSVQEREANILRRFKVTPISPLPILVAAMVSGWLLYLPGARRAAGAGAFPIRHAAAAATGSRCSLMVTLGVCALRAIGLILAAVTNTMQEAMIAIQLLYMPMLFLSGATIPAAMLPKWAQTRGGVHAGLLPGERLPGHLLPQSDHLRQPARRWRALLVTIVLGTFLAVQLFRWEKEEKMRRATSCGCWRCWGRSCSWAATAPTARSTSAQNQAMFRDLQRSGTFLIRNTRVFTGDGKVIENGCVLVRDGKIAEVYRGRRRPTPKSSRRGGGRRGQDAAARPDRRARAPGGRRAASPTSTRGLRPREDHAARRRGAAL